ncbi:uncharacterized protein LOC125236008 [Leguminivora glycinivorella]|uniref:uncharacterized protein LOC125236008 n=1 Tax=Leguminivora glycinivorella TaxID=1035111 RepID=UPI00200CC07A|nr:uncharacterized protein LOC125236008 [Leguminivora glycinivorella]
MCSTLNVVFNGLILQAIWGSVFSSLLDPRTASARTAKVNENKYCYSCVKIDNICYNHSYLFELPAHFGDHPVVERLGIMKSTNVLYYTFEPKFSNVEYSKVGFVSLNYTFHGVISGWQPFNFGPFDINQEERKVYLGGTDGIWFVEDMNYFPTYFSVKSNLITNVVVKDHVYFTTLFRKGIFKYVNGNLHIHLGDKWVHNFVLDAVDNIVYLNDSGLYISLYSSNQEDVKLSNKDWITGLTADGKGTVYAWHVDGIYKVTVGNSPSEYTLKRVTGIAPDAMTFDESNNIIYSIRKNLYKLTKVATNKCFGR